MSPNSKSTDNFPNARLQYPTTEASTRRDTVLFTTTKLRLQLSTWTPARYPPCAQLGPFSWLFRPQPRPRWETLPRTSPTDDGPQKKQTSLLWRLSSIRNSRQFTFDRWQIAEAKDTQAVWHGQTNSGRWVHWPKAQLINQRGSGNTARVSQQPEVLRGFFSSLCIHVPCQRAVRCKCKSSTVPTTLSVRFFDTRERKVDVRMVALHWPDARNVQVGDVNIACSTTAAVPRWAWSLKELSRPTLIQRPDCWCSWEGETPWCSRSRRAEEDACRESYRHGACG